MQTGGLPDCRVGLCSVTRQGRTRLCPGQTAAMSNYMYSARCNRGILDRRQRGEGNAKPALAAEVLGADMVQWALGAGRWVLADLEPHGVCGVHYRGKYYSTWVLCSITQVPPSVPKYLRSAGAARESRKCQAPTPPPGTFSQCQFVTGPGSKEYLGSWHPCALVLALALSLCACSCPCPAAPLQLFQALALPYHGLLPVTNNFPAMPLGQAGGQAGRRASIAHLRKRPSSP